MKIEMVLKRTIQIVVFTMLKSICVFVLIGLGISGCQHLGNSEKQFKLLESDYTGIDFNNALNETHEMNILSYPDFYSGGGVSIGDVDNDGLSDVFFV